MEFLVPEGREPDELHPYGKLYNSNYYCEIILIDKHDTIQAHCGKYTMLDFQELALFPDMPYEYPEYCPKCKVVAEATIIANS